MYEQFRSNLKALLKKNRVKRTEIAELLNITPTTVSRYLCGDRNPTLEAAVILADYFDVSLDWLLGRQIRTDNEEVNELYNSYCSASAKDKEVIDIILGREK